MFIISRASLGVQVPVLHTQVRILGTEVPLSREEATRFLGKALREVL